ncbi:hypothetical protein BYT27DRAFT_7250908 [Phlegmacium glaucopus]|nr:hypothetical protein BYT27DRAFT_7250908 [Phlegmacium glaucopus]
MDLMKPMIREVLDAELAWQLTRSGGLFIFGWEKEPASSMHHPSRGINAPTTLHEGQFELLHKEYQVILRKTVKMRIIFLVYFCINWSHHIRQISSRAWNMALMLPFASIAHMQCQVRGYSGAPGNPFAEHWWEALDKTAWKSTRQDKTFKESLIRAKKAAVKDGLLEFGRQISV